MTGWRRGGGPIRSLPRSLARSCSGAATSSGRWWPCAATARPRPRAGGWMTKLSTPGRSPAPARFPPAASAGCRSVLRDARPRGGGLRGRARGAHESSPTVGDCGRGAARPRARSAPRTLPDSRIPAPRVTVIVPTRNAQGLVETCVRSVRRLTRYPRYELHLIDNGSDAPEALAAFDALARAGEVVLHRDPRPFNFSALNNAAVGRTDTELVCLPQQ